MTRSTGLRTRSKCAGSNPQAGRQGLPDLTRHAQGLAAEVVVLEVGLGRGQGEEVAAPTVPLLAQ